MSESIANPEVEPPVAATVDLPVTRPAYNVRATDGAYEVSIVMPGVKREDITVRLEEEVLRIEAQRREFQPEGWRPLRREIGATRYALDLRAGVPLDASRISAKWEDGVLSLRLPLREEAKAREIAVE